jgi:CRP/FNR family cyclic AMP-dependent transcriptional regulator
MPSQVDFSRLTRHVEDTERYAAGETIFGAGDTGDCMYVIKSGAVDIKVNGATVETVEAGGIFGEMALVEKAPRSAAAVAAEDCELVPVDARRFNFLVSQTPFFALDVMKVFARRLVRTHPPQP